MLRLYQSNRLERLADFLAEWVGAPGAPLESRPVVTANTGVARWLSLNLAQRLGVSANLEFSLPAAFIWRVLHAALGDDPGSSPYTPEVMTWRLFRLLDTLPEGDRRFAPVHRYLASGRARSRYELARRLAHLYDQYIVYRPDWIEEWHRGEGKGWQPALWRRLAAATGAPDWVALRARASTLTPSVVAERIPAESALFAIPNLSPGYLELLEWLGAHSEVHLFVLNPCEEYWGDIVAERDLGRMIGVADERDLYVESGNSLLASWGRQGRDLIDLLENVSGREEAGAAFVVPAEPTLLHAVQTQILQLRNPGEGDQPPVAVAAGDRSLQVHVCHSPMREIEVLHDQLLALMESDDTLEPSDIVVMMPDVERHAPYIDAVFGSAPRQRRLPFGIADRDPRSSRPLIETFLSILELHGGRFAVDKVLPLLETPAVRRNFGLSEDDLDHVQDCVRGVRIRWGLDAANRTDLGLPATSANTWRAGLDRLLLGLAMPGESRGPFAGILPFDAVEGTSAQAVGALAEFIERLSVTVAAMDRPATLIDWSARLVQLLQSFFAPDREDEEDMQSLFDACTALAGMAQRAGYAEPVTADVVRTWLAEQLAQESFAGAFLGRGITFCQMVPARALPFRVVALVGMDDTRFPRIQPAAGFDLISRQPRRGDRSRRHEDRMLFLETLLAARDTFYVSYVGRGIRDDAPQPPSVLVSELLEYCERSFRIDGETGVAAAITVTHPLQSFSRRYFDGTDERMMSYSAERARAVAQSGSASPQPLCAVPLGDPAEELLSIELDALATFFAKPAREFVRERLGARFPGETEVLEAREPTVVESLPLWQLRTRILELLEAGQDATAVRAIVSAEGRLPHGTAGRLLLDEKLAEMERIRAARADFWPAAFHPPLSVDLDIDGVQITGQLRHVANSGFYDARVGRTRGADRLGLWLRHLVLNRLDPTGVFPRSHWLADDGGQVLRPVEDANKYLEALVALYRRGLSEPLPFEPESGWAYIETLNTSNDHDRALDAARKKWSGARGVAGFTADQDAYIERAFRHTTLSQDHFARVTSTLFGGWYEHVEEGQ